MSAAPATVATGTGTGTGTGSSGAEGRPGAGSPVAGTWPLLRFMLRRERVGLPIWLLGAGALFAVQSNQSQEFFDSAEALAELRATSEGNATLIAMAGPLELAETVGGEAVWEVFSYVAIVVALMVMFLVGRHTRAEEEAGRAELLRSARVGRHAPLAAALTLAVLASAGAGLAVFAAGVGTGLPLGGSVLVGFAIASVGVAFAGLSAVAAQVFENTRGVYGSVVALLGAAWVLRAVGDVGDGTASWFSPIGWGQRTFPYSDDRWWPLLLSVGVLAVGAATAAALVAHRDLGAGLVQARLGRARASWALRSPLGLAWRLQRGSLAGWGAGVLLLGVAMGGFGETMEDFVADNPDIAEFLPGGAQAVVDGFFVVILSMTALLAMSFGVSAVLRARTEETAGRAEPVLGTATSRWAWLGSHLTVALGGSAVMLALGGLGSGLAYGSAISDAGQVPRLVALSLVYVPAVWLVVGVAALLVGALPRAASPAAWALVAYGAVVAFFGEPFELPEWALGLSPVDQTPQVPLDDVTAQPLLVLGALAAVAVVGGLVGFRRRDLESV